MLGCDGGGDRRGAAFQEAQAALRRHENTLANIRRESGRLRGERRVYTLEASFLAGNLTPVDFILLQRIRPARDRWVPSIERLRRLSTVPTGFHALFRFGKERFVDLPWYDRSRSQTLLRQSTERYAVLLSGLEKREREEEAAVRNAADYARLLAPQ